MTMVTNVSNRTLCLAGVTLHPREMESVNVPARKLASHLFVRAGWIEVSGVSSAPAPAQSEPESTQEVSDESASDTPLEDMDRDQLAEYARANHPDLFIGNKGRERLLNDILEAE